jgi:replicative DNA helicase
MFIYREEYYHSRAEPKKRPNQSEEQFQEEVANFQRRGEEVHNKADIIVAKQRNGPIGTFQLIFNGQYSEFCNMEYRENLVDGR